MASIDLGQLVAVLQKMAAADEAPAAPDVHMSDTVDNRRYMAASDKVTCKGWKRPVEFHVAVAGRDNSVLLAASPAQQCGQTELPFGGYCRYHKDQRGVPADRVRAYGEAHPTKTYIPMPDRRAVEELARTLGIKVISEAKPAANAA